MRRISPVFFFSSLALMALLTACGGSDDEAATTTVTAAEALTTTTPPVVDEPTTTEAEPVDEPTTTEAEPVDEPTTTEAEPVDDEVAVLCGAYLDSISFATADSGLQQLTEILGPDAPPGIQDALDTLADPEGDIERYFAAQNSLDGYVLPICEGTFSTKIVPAADDAAAADGFVAAVRDGDLAAAEQLAPTNVIVSFDWNGFPDATWEFSPDNSTVNMLLEPTVTVFCQIDGGRVEFCAFGE